MQRREREEHLLAKKRNIVFLVLCCICVLAVVSMAFWANFRTYVVRVDNATGRIEAGNELIATNYEPREAEKIYFLSNFIKNIRTIPLDPVVFRSNWNNAQYFMTQEASRKLNVLMTQEKPMEKLGKATIQITINSIQTQPGTDDTYQIRWTEDEFSLSGDTNNIQNHYIALVSIAIVPPTKEQELKINPLGLTIKDLNYSTETI